MSSENNTYTNWETCLLINLEMKPLVFKFELNLNTSIVDTKWNVYYTNVLEECRDSTSLISEILIESGHCEVF